MKMRTYQHVCLDTGRGRRREQSRRKSIAQTRSILRCGSKDADEGKAAAQEEDQTNTCKNLHQEPTNQPFKVKSRQLEKSETKMPRGTYMQELAVLLCS